MLLRMLEGLRARVRGVAHGKEATHHADNFGFCSLSAIVLDAQAHIVEDLSAIRVWDTVARNSIR